MAEITSNPAAASVRLRDVTEDDLPIFFQHQLDPEAIRMAAFRSRSWAAFLVHWSKILGDDTIIKKTIVCDGQVAGNIVSFGRPDEREVGYWLGRAYWGKGIATAALAELLHQIKTRPLYAHVTKHNTASLRVLQKCGFTISGEDKSLAVVPSEQIDEFVLTLS